MGNLNRKIGVVLLFPLALISSAQAENRILERLEQGEVISSKTGSSFFVQALVNKEPEKVQAAFADLSALPKVFPQIAFATPYSGPDGRNFVYLKLRGLGDGTSVLMEVKAGGGDAFQNARALVLDADYQPARDTTSDADSSKESNQLELQKAMSAANAQGTSQRFLGVTTSLVLEGPLNEVPELPNVRVTLNLGTSVYLQTAAPATGPLFNAPLFGGPLLPAPVRKTYLIAKLSFGNQSAKKELGDYRGFGEHRLSLAEQMGVNVFAALKANLDK